MEEVGKLIVGLLMGFTLGNVVYALKLVRSSGVFFLLLIIYTILIIAILVNVGLL